MYYKEHFKSCINSREYYYILTYLGMLGFSFLEICILKNIQGLISSKLLSFFLPQVFSLHFFKIKDFFNEGKILW